MPVPARVQVRVYSLANQLLHLLHEVIIMPYKIVTKRKLVLLLFQQLLLLVVCIPPSLAIDERRKISIHWFIELPII